MSDKNAKVIPLDRVRDPVAGIIELPGYGQHKVRKYTGLQYQKAALLTDASPVSELYDLVRQVVPTLPEEAVLSLDKDQCFAITTLASQGVAAVEALFPNAVSPETPTSPG